MPKPRFDRTAKTCRGSLLLAAACLLPACSGVETHTLNIGTAASATQLEAKQVVALVYAQASDAEINQAPYSGGDLWGAIRRLRDRYPQLKPWLDQGAIGMTSSGFVALRDDAMRAQLRDLLWDENHDRALLHTGTSVAVGHSSTDLYSWLPYASYSFGTEWITQGQPGWWWLDDERQWHRK